MHKVVRTADSMVNLKVSMDELKSMTLTSGEVLGIPHIAGSNKEHRHIDPGSSGGFPDLEDSNV